MIDVLKFINKKLETAGINYQFGEWKGAIKYPYFVGSIHRMTIQMRTKRHPEH